MPADHKSLQYKVWVIVMSKPFDTFILVLIALNTGVLMSQVGRLKLDGVCLNLTDCSVYRDILVFFKAEKKIFNLIGYPWPYSQWRIEFCFPVIFILQSIWLVHHLWNHISLCHVTCFKMSAVHWISVLLFLYSITSKTNNIQTF